MMLARDFIKLSISAVVAQKMRSILTALGITVGIAAVVLLTSIGEGIHKYVANEFATFGTNVLAVVPGKTMTHGSPVGIFGSVRPLTIEDSKAIREIPAVEAVLPITQGNTEVKVKNRSRRTTVYGVGSELSKVLHVNISMGRFLPDDDPISPRAFVVLGAKVKTELFQDQNPLGEKIRVGDQRYVVIGVTESKGQILGTDLDDCVYIPAARSLDLFNREGLMKINVVHSEYVEAETVVKQISHLLEARHGSEDFTIQTQEQMMEVLDSVLDILTFAVGALGSISLFVGGIGILTIMTIAVNERTSEIGLFIALGARKGQVLMLFLGEAIILAALGGLAGLVVGAGGAHLLGVMFPALPVYTPLAYVILAESLAIAIGLIAGVLPARRAANLQPVDALRAE